MNNISIYKEVTETRVGQWDGSDWLRRIGMFDLVLAMEMLSGEYDLAWADQWQRNLDDPRWLDKAMVNTFGRLNDADKQLVAPLYEDWCWCVANLDLAAAVKLGYVAEVALLWGGGQRVVDGGRVQTVLVSLDGTSRDDALCQLNREYEFLRWW